MIYLEAGVMLLLGLMLLIAAAVWAVCLIAVRKRSLRDWMPMECWIVAAFLVCLYSLAVFQ